MFFYLFSQSIIDILHSTLPKPQKTSLSVKNTTYKFFKKNGLFFEQEKEQTVVQEQNTYKAEGYLTTFAQQEDSIYFFSQMLISKIGFLFVSYKKPIKIWTIEGKALENYQITHYDNALNKQEHLNTWQWIALPEGFYLVGDEDISRSLVFVKENQVFQKIFDEIEQKPWSIDISGQAGEQIFKEYILWNQVESKGKTPVKIFGGDSLYLQMKNEPILFRNSYKGQILIERAQYYDVIEKSPSYNATDSDVKNYCFLQIYDPRGIISYTYKDKALNVLEGIELKTGFFFFYSFEENLYSINVNNKNIQIPCIKGYYILSNIDE